MHYLQQSFDPALSSRNPREQNKYPARQPICIDTTTILCYKLHTALENNADAPKALRPRTG